MKIWNTLDEQVTRSKLTNSLHIQNLGPSCTGWAHWALRGFWTCAS